MSPFLAKVPVRFFSQVSTSRRSAPNSTMERRPSCALSQANWTMVATEGSVAGFLSAVSAKSAERSPRVAGWGFTRELFFFISSWS